MCTNCIPHMVNSTNLSSLNHSLVVHLPNWEFIILNFHEIHYKMNGNVKWIGPIFPCSETGLLVLKDGDWKMEFIHVYKPYMYIIWSITLVLVHLIIHFFVHLSICECTIVSFHEIHYKMNRMVSELSPYFLVVKSASSCERILKNGIGTCVQITTSLGQ